MTDRHMEKAREIAMDMPSRVTAAHRPFIEAVVGRALREAEREGMRRAAEIAQRHPGINYEEGGWMKWRLPSQHDIAAAILSAPEEAP